MKTKHLFLSLFSFFVSITISSNELHTHELYVQPDACIDGIYYKFYETEAKVTYERLEIDPSTLTDIIYTNYTGNVDIPEFVEYNGITYKVTSISNDAFRGCSSLYTINIPNTVTTIGYNAFRDCTNLTFTIPNSVTSIGGNAFLNTPWYNGQPNGMVYVGNVAYCYKGSGLQNISLRDGTLSIACNAFRNCTDLRTITIPESVTEIGEYAFANCSSLTSISIPGNVTSIGWSAFAECSKITSITIPNGVTKLEERLFSGCSQLNTIILPDNLVFIGSGAFQFCSSLESIAIPEGVTSIGGSAFRSCTSLTSLTIPNGVTCIDGQTFQNCSSLTSITIPNSVTSIEYQAFKGCTSLTSVTINIENPLSIDDGQTFSNSANATLYVPYGCKAAYEAAPYWRNFAEIIEMEAPPSNIAFADSNVKALCVANWDTNDDGELSEAEAAAVTDLGEVFRGNTSITSFDELQYFTGLTSIGNNAFYNCSSLSSVTIPGSVTSIADYAFRSCTSLSKVIVSDLAAWCGISFSFPSANPLSKAHHLYSDETTEITNLVIPEGVTSIGNFTFTDCFGLTSVTIGDGVISIGDDAFYNCSGLASVAIGDGVTSIGDDAFYNCSGLASVTIGDGVTSIGEFAFRGCSSLTSIIIPNSVTSIGKDAFDRCYGLTSVTFGNGVTDIGDAAFYECSSLTSITIPNNVTCIAVRAFAGCTSLTSVVSEIEKPFEFGEAAFGRISDDCVLTVPSGTRDAYLAAGWTEEIFKGGIVEAAAPSPSIAFADANVKAICVANWDTNGDNELSEAEAAAVTDLGEVFKGNTTITSFDELQYFTGLTEIHDYAFRNTIALTSVIIPENVTRIGKGSFGQVVDIGASNLVSVQLPDGLTEIDEDAFWECNKLKNINFPTSLRTIGECAFHNTAIESLILPEGFLSLGYSACNFCSFLKSIYIPSTVTSIGEYAFSSCNALHSIVVSEDNTVYDSRENCNALIKTETNKLIRGGNQTIIPLGICSIGDYAFDGLSNLYYVTIPKTVTSIGDGAFQNCNELLSVKVDIVEPHHITQYTFSDSWGRTYAGSATLYVPAGCKAAYEAADYWKDFKRIIEFVEGDVNGDEEVDVLDVVDIARYVVGTPAETFVPILADINYNGEVNVGDAVALVNEIAGDQNFVKPWRAPQQNSVAGDVLTLISTDNGMSLCVENERNYTAFQFDLFLPAGTDVTDLKLNALRKQGHQLIYNKVEEGHYRVAAISTSNRTFSGYEGELLAVGLEGIANEDICLRDIRFFTTDGEEHLFDDIVMQSGTATDIASPQQPSNGDEAIYNLAGQRIQKMRKGINIINGKKIAF